MDSKRKANGSRTAGVVEDDDRAPKRRKVSLQDFDLFKEETSESTTQYGLAFLEQIRRTSDKSGRPVATVFEKLPSKTENPDYYERILMPISLEKIEQKLLNRDFADMSELESYFKRMITNAKEYYHRNSQAFDDAERVRKAVSNYMVKTNPAYKKVAGYSAVATPLPDQAEGEKSEPKAEEEQEDGADEDAEAADQEVEDGGEEEDEEEEEEGDPAEEDGDEDEGHDEDEDEDEEAVTEQSKRGRRPIIVKRGNASTREGGRATRKTSERIVDRERVSSTPTKTDIRYADVPYKGLTFQQAQEKIIDELLRRKEPGDEWQYFEPFVNLPPRSLKDYYQVTREPVSLKSIQKLVKGFHGRAGTTGVSDFKTWAAFEEKASRLWVNAFFYNEDGSEIAVLAKELQEAFNVELEQAKADVPEPPQPKIKLKLPPTEPTPNPKKITIHVATRGSSASSPAPATAQASESRPTNAGAGVSRTMPDLPPSSVGLPSASKVGSASAPSPSPAVNSGREDVNRQSPAVNGNGAIAPQSPAIKPGSNQAQQPTGGPTPLPQPQVVPNIGPVYDSKYRVPGRYVSDALVTSLCLRTHPSVNERRFYVHLQPDPKLAQRCLTLNIPANHWKMQVIPTLQPFELQQRPYKLYVIVNGMTLGRSVPNPLDPVEKNAHLFDCHLHAGVNVIQVHAIAGMPAGQKLSNGSDVELEKFTILANVMRP